MVFAKLRLVLLTVVGAGLLAPTLVCAEPPGKDGLFLSVRNPITSNTVEEIKRKIDSAVKKKGRQLDTIVFDFNYDGQKSGTSNFGACWELYKLIHRQPGDNKVKTMAFVSNEIAQHTVLPVLACQQRIMSKALNDSKTYKARIGDILRGQDRPLEQRELDAYSENKLGDIVNRMMNKDLTLKKVKTGNGTTLWVSPATLQQHKDYNYDHDDIGPGSSMLDPDQCIKVGLCEQHLLDSREDVRKALGLSRKSLREEWFIDRTPIVWRIEVKGGTSKGNIDSLERRIKNAVSKGANVIILQLEASGGDTTHIASLATSLSKLTDDNQQPIRTIAWIPPDASLGALTFLAVGCTEIVMAPSAVLGDFSYLGTAKPDDLVQRWNMLKPLVEARGYPPLLFQATLDPNLVLYSVAAKNDPSDKRLMTQKEFEADKALPNPLWGNPELITSAGQPLKITTSRAQEFGVAEPGVVASQQALYDEYLGLTDLSQVHVARDDWLDRVAEFFREPLVNFLLVMIGIIGLILELKMPGTTVPGVIAAVCFVLFFWSYSFVGEFTLLAVLLFVLGVILIGVEIFVLPGFGFTGISGVLLMVGSLALVTLERWPTTNSEWTNLGVTFGTFGGSLVAALLGVLVIAWYLPSIPYANRLVLKPPAEEMTTPDPAVPVALLGAIGVATTSLRPAGTAQFGDDFHDVMAEGDFVNPGQRVQVIEIEGNRIVVKEI